MLKTLVARWRSNYPEYITGKLENHGFLHLSRICAKSCCSLGPVYCLSLSLTPALNTNNVDSAPCKGQRLLEDRQIEDPLVTNKLQSLTPSLIINIGSWLEAGYEMRIYLTATSIRFSRQEIVLLS